MRSTISGGTDRGRKREHNEDSFLIVDLDTDRASDRMQGTVGEAGVLLAVSDGLGGAPAGEVASAATVHSLYEELKAQGIRGDEKQLLRVVVARTNSDVLEAASRPSREGMGATLTAALLRNGVASLAQVGDSRAYLLRDGRLRQVTHDQSWVQMMVDEGKLSPDEAEHHPKKNIVSQVMGQAKPVRADVGQIAVRANDRLLLCSDGLFNAIDEEAIAQLLAGADPVPALIAAANSAGGPDNITVVVALIEG